MQIDWAVVAATIAGPILAVWASEWRQSRRAEENRRNWVFQTLWATRATRLAPEHIAALNQIDLAFPAKDYPKIADKWALYLGHLNTRAEATEAGQALWFQTGSNLLVDLVHLMASEIGTPLPESLVKLSSYYPSGHAFTEGQFNELRALMLQVLKGERAIPIRPFPSEQPKP